MRIPPHSNKTLTHLLCVALGSFWSTSYADIEYMFVFKEQVFEQFDNTPTDTPSFWFFNAGASGNDQLTGGPVTLSGEPEVYSTDSVDYLNQAAIDAVFPNGQVSTNLREWVKLTTIAEGDGGFYDFSLNAPEETFYRVAFDAP